MFASLSPYPEYLIKPYNAVFLKSPWSKDIKTDIPNCQIHKHTNTNSQIQLMTKCQKYPTYAIFLNSWWFKYVKNDIRSDIRYGIFLKAGGSRMSNMIFSNVPSVTRSNPRSDQRSKSPLVDFRLLHCPPGLSSLFSYVSFSWNLCSGVKSVWTESYFL